MRALDGVICLYVIDEKGVIANAGFAGTLEQLEALVEDSREYLVPAGGRSPCTHCSIRVRWWRGGDRS